MSKKRYYTDAYTHQFQANILESVTENGRFALVLDQTYFYPTSGGQPFDTGQLNHIPIVDVTIREADDVILHWIDGHPPETSKVTATINWQRRFDHMQQHSGQHILSQSFIRVADAATESFHLSDNSVTIDLHAKELTSTQLAATEQLANEIVWQNRPIQVRFVTLEEAHQLPIRKIPPVNDEKLRLIEIEDFDLTACGGTHVAATGGVGLIKIVKVERRKGQIRVEFCCGGRALQDYHQKHAITSELMNQLTTGLSDLTENIGKIQKENKQLQQTVNKQQASLLTFTAAQLRENAEYWGPLAIVTHIHDGEASELRLLAQQLTSQPQTIALLGTIGNKTHLLFARSDDAPGDMSQLLKTAFQQLGTGSGGGKANAAQGGGGLVTHSQLQNILSHAKSRLLSEDQS